MLYLLQNGCLGFVGIINTPLAGYLLESRPIGEQLFNLHLVSHCKIFLKYFPK